MCLQNTRLWLFVIPNSSRTGTHVAMPVVNLVASSRCISRTIFIFLSNNVLFYYILLYIACVETQISRELFGISIVQLIWLHYYVCQAGNAMISLLHQKSTVVLINIANTLQTNRHFRWLSEQIVYNNYIIYISLLFQNWSLFLSYFTHHWYTANIGKCVILLRPNYFWTTQHNTTQHNTTQHNTINDSQHGTVDWNGRINSAHLYFTMIVIQSASKRICCLWICDMFLWICDLFHYNHQIWIVLMSRWVRK